MNGRYPYPLGYYIIFIAHIYGRQFAMHQLGERLQSYPEFESFVSYIAATNPAFMDMMRKVVPEWCTIPDRNRLWEEIVAAFSRRGLRSIEMKYDDIYPPPEEYAEL